MSKKYVIPVSLATVLNSVRQLKSKSMSSDGIRVNQLNLESVALISHLQLFLQICLSSSLVPDSFLCRTVNSTLKRGNDPLNCNYYRLITVACNLS